MMRTWLIQLSLVCFIVTISSSGYSQAELKGWHLLDPQKDTFYGISIDKTYGFLKGKTFQPIIVGVIDSGVDTTHEDLKNVLWHNTKEIPNNGIDDDGNGYVDDYYGWNFLGNKEGSNLKKDVDERTRVYYRFKNKFSGKSIDEDTLGAYEKHQYQLWQQAAKEINSSSDEQVEVMLLDVTLKALKKHDKVLRDEMKKDEFSYRDVEDFEASNNKARQAKMGYLTCMKMLGFEADEKNTTIISELSDYVENKKEAADAKTNAPPDYRAQIIGDDYFNINDKYYGNADVMGPSPLHGTHVSGIIAAQRDNNLGAQGVADHVKIMMVRAIPDGDEYDKDVALAIKYAVDNGARVINMSFGKSFSPEKKWVDEAIHYAETKDVLIVHASGNESTNIDEKTNYPNNELLEFRSKASNFINVGASGDPKVADGKIIADFSNYGKNNVDVFAPGVKIYSTLPGGHEYGFLKGTSMAAPVVTGIAAIIRSYYPDLTAKQVKYIIEKSAIPLSDTSTQLFIPGTKEKACMDDLCQTGGFVNAYAAIKLAAALQEQIDLAKRPIDKLPKTTIKNARVKD
ncbi:S8 family peptidase [Danxiaibacter flavus]|uniref:S8 family peptidase n=1 Tax=Danxiaibacter flavus TaxID=3049108 RepID=A0ABV3ZC64_9BACT|nr:S8 family peptidase [Chitinophagaceae bacterium DXS]